MLSTDILIFGPFHLDLRAEQLWRGTEAAPLPPKTFAVLRYLVLHAGTLITRDAVLEAVWGTQYVSDAALASCIRDIRQALGEQAQHLLYEAGFTRVAVQRLPHDILNTYYVCAN
jgi:DNA-binding winged helix-turn-helix (wHTH) protein